MTMKHFCFSAPDIRSIKHETDLGVVLVPSSSARIILFIALSALPMSSIAMFLAFVFSILPRLASSGSMIVTYGQPRNYSSYQSVSTDSWENCVMYCYELDSCVVRISSFGFSIKKKTLHSVSILSR